MDKINAIRDYQNKKLQVEERRKREILEIKEMLSINDGPLSVELKDVGGGYFELTIVADEIINEFKDLLDFIIVKDKDIRNHEDGIELVCRLDYDPSLVYQSGYVYC